MHAAATEAGGHTLAPRLTIYPELSLAAERWLDPAVRPAVLAASGARTAYAASWDAHHVAVLGAFATGIGSQAYQFQVPDPDALREPVPGLTLTIATTADLDYLESTGWQDDSTSYVDRNAMSVVRLDGRDRGRGAEARSSAGA